MSKLVNSVENKAEGFEVTKDMLENIRESLKYVCVNIDGNVKIVRMPSGEVYDFTYDVVKRIYTEEHNNILAGKAGLEVAEQLKDWGVQAVKEKGAKAEVKENGSKDTESVNTSKDTESVSTSKDTEKKCVGIEEMVCGCIPAKKIAYSLDYKCVTEGDEVKIEKISSGKRYDFTYDVVKYIFNTKHSDILLGEASPEVCNTLKMWAAQTIYDRMSNKVVKVVKDESSYNVDSLLTNGYTVRLLNNPKIGRLLEGIYNYPNFEGFSDDDALREAIEHSVENVFREKFEVVKDYYKGYKFYRLRDDSLLDFTPESYDKILFEYKGDLIVPNDMSDAFNKMISERVAG